MSSFLRSLAPGGSLRRRCFRWAMPRLVQPLVELRRPLIVAVTGTNGKSTVCKLLERIYREAGYRTGAATTDGVKLDGRWLLRGDYAGGNGLWRILVRRRPDVVIAETSRGGLIRFGVGFRRCRCAVVTNVTSDHLDEDGIHTLDELAEVKRRIVTRADMAVLNAVDARVARMAEGTPARVVYFNGPMSSSGGEFVSRQDGALWWNRAGRRERLCDVADLAVAAGGVIDYQVENAMATLAAVCALRDERPVPDEALLRALRAFGRDPRDNEGRCTLVRYRGALVLLLQCKNEEGYRRSAPIIARVRQSWSCAKVVGLLADVGRKPDAVYPRLAAMASAFCDEVVVGPPHRHYLLARTADELVRLLAAGVPGEKLRCSDGETLDQLLQRGDRDRTLFVCFRALDDARVDLKHLLAAGEALSLDAPH